MDETNSLLSPHSIAILALIAAGRSYEQILRALPGFTLDDIYNAADEALKLAEDRPAKSYSLAHIRQRHERAYLPWAKEEDEQLRTLLGEGHTVAQVAGQLQRQRSAIRSRIKKLGLVEVLSGKERTRFERIEARIG